MIDREKIITALECCKDVHQSGRWASGCISCGYADKHRPDCFLRLADDAVELLKEQEAVEPILKRQGRNKYYNYYVCRCCNEELFYHQNYCSECGRAVKWE